MIEETVEMLASRDVDGSVEDRLGCLEEFVHLSIRKSAKHSIFGTFCLGLF